MLVCEGAPNRRFVQVFSYTAKIELDIQLPRRVTEPTSTSASRRGSPLALRSCMSIRLLLRHHAALWITNFRRDVPSG